MNITHLRYLVEVERTGSITRAAQSLYMGQPNLSKVIKDMESSMGIIIFKRTARGVEPTRKGSMLLDYAKKLLMQVDEFESVFTEKDSTLLSLGIAVPRATYCSLAFVRTLASMEQEEKLNVSFRESDAMSSISMMAEGDIDLAVIRFHSIYEDYFVTNAVDRGLKVKPLAEFQMQLLMSENHPLAKRKKIPYHMLSGYTEIMHGDYNVSTLSFAKIKRDGMLPPPAKSVKICDRGSQYDLLTEVPGTYMWVSPIDPDYLDQHHLVIRRCPVSSEICKDVIITPVDKKMSTFEKSFVEQLHLELEKGGFIGK